MGTNEYDFQVLKLTDDFYNAYTRAQYREILEKNDRPYNCIIFEVSNDYFVCVPYRTEIKHQYAYHFRRTTRSIQHKSGLDYTKMVIVKNTIYLGCVQAVIDNDEYIETVSNIHRIKDEAFDFLEKYIKHVKGESLLHHSEYRRRYQYSPLKYFHSELGI